MRSKHTMTAIRIARKLAPAETAMNEAAVRILHLGAEVLAARTTGEFHPIESQDTVDRIGRATTMMFTAMREMADAHGGLRRAAADRQILGFGDEVPCPDIDQDHELGGNVAAIAVAA